MIERNRAELEAVSSRAVQIATSLLRVPTKLAEAVLLKEIPRDGGIYIWRFCSDSSPAYIGVGLGQKGLYQRLAAQHLRPSYLKSVFRKAVVAEYGVDPRAAAVNYIKSHFSLAYLACSEETYSVVGIAESMLIATLQPKYNKAKK